MLVEQIFVMLLLCDRPYSRRWGFSKELRTQAPPAKSFHSDWGLGYLISGTQDQFLCEQLARFIWPLPVCSVGELVLMFLNISVSRLFNLINTALYSPLPLPSSAGRNGRLKREKITSEAWWVCITLVGRKLWSLTMIFWKNGKRKKQSSGAEGVCSWQPQGITTLMVPPCGPLLHESSF